jgi:nucleoside 2-deoxyribosyltransferase
MNVYIICPVRNCSPERTAAIRAHAERLRKSGYTVHFPTDDVNQDDPTGAAICRAHLDAMLAADFVHVFWDVNSKGSHFDLGMAYAMGKPITPVECYEPDPPGKSYWKVMQG